MGGKRELVEPHEGDKRFMRRDESGQFSESDDLNRSLSSDNDRDAQRTSEPGQGDKGDRARRGDSTSSSESSRMGSSSSGTSKTGSSSHGSGSMRGAAGRRNPDNR